MSNLLVVEDETHIAAGLQFNLEAEGYAVTVAEAGESALALLANGTVNFDLVILDAMLPGIDGFAVASELRARNQYVPVLMLTARSRPEDVLKGFAAGADDYLAKPFDLPILMARVKGLLRRRAWLRTEQATLQDVSTTQSSDESDEVQTNAAQKYVFDGREVDFLHQELHAQGKTHQLTLMETELLRYLVKNAGKPVSRKAILEDVWQLHEDTDTRAIDNFVVRLRRYIEDNPAQPKYLVTVRGVGYRFVPLGKESTSP